MIELQGINKWYGAGSNRLHVLQDLTLTIDAGEFTAIMGASGSGKSTLLNILGLMDGYDGGEYRLDGVTMKDLSETKAALYRSRMVGFVFQSFNLIPFKTAAENVALPLYYQKVGRRARLARARQHLEQVGLLDWAEHLPSELSGGQQQRVAIARALVARPKLLLADEPTGALDSATSLEVVEMLAAINRTGVTVVVVTHERDVAERTGRIIALCDGRIADDTRRTAPRLHA